ncbi:MAG: hypothetical protein ACREPE_16045 [Lysobacter sp.]
MNMTREPPIDEREWQAQERGMRAAHGDDTDVADFRTAHYRVVAQALRSTPRSQPPADFASSVARLAVTRSDAGLERTLSQILLVVFAISSLMVIALYGGRWWQSIHQAVGDDTLAWLLAGMGCLILSWLFDQLRFIGHDSDLEAAR